MTVIVHFPSQIKALLFSETQTIEHPRSGSMKDAEIYVRRSQRESDGRHRQISDISSTISITTLNTQSSGSPTDHNKPHIALQDTLSGTSVISLVPECLTESYASPEVVSEPGMADNKSTEDRNGYGNEKDCPEIGQIFLKINKDEDEETLKKNSVKSVHFEVDDKDNISPTSITGMLSHAN